MANPTPENPLPEKDFIQNNIEKNPFPYLLWGCIFTVLLCLLWGGWSWYAKKMNFQYAENPFLQVKNRDFSLFLWQFPEHMRANTKNKAGYLPAFQLTERIGMDPTMAEEYVVAPPDVIFLYHAWQRLLSGEFIPRPIPIAEFKEFITTMEEWDPKYWTTAPEGYVKLIANLSTQKTEDLSTLPQSELPQSVRIAFQGWKNYMKEGEAINRIKPTNVEMADFIAHYPHYARNYWRNILLITYPKYLISLSKDDDKKTPLPQDEIAPFLRAAFYNYSQAQKNQ
jgi:hypothetical protein